MKSQIQNIKKKFKNALNKFIVLDFASTCLHVFVNVTSFIRFTNDITSRKF